MRLVIGITGASGAVLGVRLLETLGAHGDIETHLVMSRWAKATLELETGLSTRDVGKLASVVHPPGDMGASIASGSFRTAGMVVVPCSMRTLAGIRAGCAEGLVGRAADVTLKERRRLVLVPRETPLSEIHLENMLALARMGVAIVPPMPAFYHRLSTVDDMVSDVAARVLDQLDIETDARRWTGWPERRGARDTQRGA